MQERGQDQDNGEGKTAREEEIRRPENGLLNFGGGHDIEHEPADEEDAGDRLWQAELSFP